MDVDAIIRIHPEIVIVDELAHTNVEGSLNEKRLGPGTSMSFDIAGVGKSYRMLQEAHELLENGVDVQIGYIETHGRAPVGSLYQIQKILYTLFSIIHYVNLLF